MTARQLIAMAIDCENKQVFLLTKILEMLKNQPEAEEIRKVFTYLLAEEKKHCENLQPFINA
jgi:rubrerythrin